MKRFKLIIGFTIVLYAVLATAVYLFVQGIREQRSNAHHIDINRIMGQLIESKSVEDVNLQEYETIKQITFLEAEDRDPARLRSFYQESNQNSYVIQPWYQDHQLRGYLKFIYRPQHFSLTNFLILSEGLLALIEGLVLLLLWYLKKHILTPFQQLSDLPQQMVHGHYKGEIKTEKSRYFRQYLWGMGQLKDELEVSRKRQYELMKEKKQMLLSLSHDIKTPLNLIKLYSKGVEEAVFDEAASRKAMVQINTKCNEIERYVDAIMQSSREDILDIAVDNSEFYLKELLENTLSVYLDQCQKRNLTWIMDPYQNCLLKGDLHRAQEVLENLLENALKYGDGRQIHMSFREEDYCQLICVFNTGAVVEDQELNHLFDSFYRGANAQGKAGSGLGLYICRQLMRKMDGDIFLEKRPDGMAFTMVFRF